MPFGLKHAAQAFQWLIDKVCIGMEFVFIYINNILVASFMNAEHYDHLWQLHACLVEHGLVVNMVKCKFEKPTLEFLGHCIDKHRVSPLPSKVQTVAEFRKPNTVKDLPWYGKVLPPFLSTHGCHTPTSIHSNGDQE